LADQEPLVRSRAARAYATTIAAFAIAVVLSGCGIVPFFPTASSTVDPSTHLPRGFFTLIGDGDMPDGANFRPDHSEYREEDNARRVVDLWKSIGAAPQSCFAAWAAPYLMADGVGSTDDLVVGIGYFEYDYDTQGGVWAGARQFADDRAADAFMEFLDEVVAACPDGYSAFNDDGSRWGIDRLTLADVSPLLELPDGVDVVDEIEWINDVVVARYAFVHYENAVVRISCDVRDVSPFTFEDCKRLTETVATRLVALTF
jgi:hypothetical protein